MRTGILYILGAYPLWSETFVRQDLSSLLKLGVPLRPVALFPGNVERESDWPEVTCLEHPGPDASRRAVLRLGRCPSLVARWLPKYVYTKLSVLRHHGLRRILGGIVKQEGIRHIHAEFADLPAVLGASLARSRRLTYSVSVHARDVHLCKFHAGTLFRRASFVTACNTMALNAVLESCPAVLDRAHLIYHGLELEEWPFRFEPRPVAAPLRLAFVGRFVSKKGLRTLLRALARVHEDGPPTELTLAGAGPLEPELRQQAASLGIEPAIRWEGVVSRDRVREIVTEADALVVPSVIAGSGDRDGIPNVVLEAMALGTPVIGTQVGSLPEVLTEHTGWTVKAGDADGLAHVVRQFGTEADRTEERRREARSLIDEKFNAAKLALERADLFDHLGLTPEKS